MRAFYYFITIFVLICLVTIFFAKNTVGEDKIAENKINQCVTNSKTLTKLQYFTEYNNPTVIRKLPDKVIIKYEKEDGTIPLKSLYFTDMSDDLKTYLGFNQVEYDKEIANLNSKKDLIKQNNVNTSDSLLNINKIKASVNGSKKYIIIPNGWVYNLKGTNIQIPERDRNDVYKKYDKYTVIDGEVYILDSSDYRYVKDYYKELKLALDNINNQISELNKERQEKLKSANYTHRHASYTSTFNNESYSTQIQDIKNDYNMQINNLKEKSNYSSISSMVSKLKRYAE